MNEQNVTPAASAPETPSPQTSAPTASAPQTTPAPKPKIPLPETHRRDYVYCAVMLILSILTANCVYVGGLALGFAIFAFALIICSLCYIAKKLHKSALGILSLISACITVISFGVHENTSFAFFKFLFLILSLAVFVVDSCKLAAPSLDDFRALLAPFYLFFGVSCKTMPTALRCVGGKSGKAVGKILLALFVSSPLIAILTVLLAFADEAFESFIDSAYIRFDEIFRTVISGAVLFIFVFSLIFAIVKSRVTLKASAKKPYLSVIDGTFTNTVLVTVSLLYLVFLCTQISYIFGGFAGLLPEDYTYSAYARRGFFEMCFICVINLCVIFIAEVFVKRSDDKIPAFTRILLIFIRAFSMFLIASAIAKMLMYIRSYGLTFMRLGTSIFMLFLFFVFGAQILNAFFPRFSAMRTVLATACVIMSLCAIFEPYNIIASYNLYAYENGMHDEYELDTNYFAYYCGAYGVDALIELAADENVYVANRAQEHLESMHASYYYSSDTDIRKMSIARLSANQSLAKYYSK